LPCSAGRMMPLGIGCSAVLTPLITGGVAGVVAAWSAPRPGPSRSPVLPRHHHTHTTFVAPLGSPRPSRRAAKAPRHPLRLCLLHLCREGSGGRTAHPQASGGGVLMRGTHSTSLVAGQHADHGLARAPQRSDRGAPGGVGAGIQPGARTAASPGSPPRPPGAHVGAEPGRAVRPNAAPTSSWRPPRQRVAGAGV
jgi:hypothetical protein